MGMVKGDRVAVLLRNCRQYIELFLALSKTGGILVPLNWRLALPETEFIVRDSSPRFIVFDEEFAGNAAMLRERLLCSKIVFCTSGECKGLAKFRIGLSNMKVQSWHTPTLNLNIPLGKPGQKILTSLCTRMDKLQGFLRGLSFHTEDLLQCPECRNLFLNLTSKDIAMIARPLFHPRGTHSRVCTNSLQRR
jgi:fatty-acyl-CoA synthase